MTTLGRLSKEVDISYGSPLNRFAIVDEGQGKRYFVWMAHHSTFDAWCLRMVYETFEKAYEGHSFEPSKSFAGFISYVEDMDHEAASQYWVEQLQGARPTPIPAAQHSPTPTRKTKVYRKSMPFTQPTNSAITKASVIRAAWALLLSRYADTDDVCFGATVSGRQAPIPNIEAIAGPTISSVPVRIDLDRDASVHTYLENVQTQVADMVPFEQFGLRNIAKLSSNAREATNFSHLLVIQPAQFMEEGDEHAASILSPLDDEQYRKIFQAQENYSDYPLVIQVFVGQDNISFEFNYKDNVFLEEQLVAISHQLEHVLTQLLGNTKSLLRDVAVAGPWDLKKATSWNKTPDLIASCVHDLISVQAMTDPNHQAIFSTQVTLSYAELERLSDKFANYLRSIGVGPEVAVPVCHEKSPWVVVAMLGIMKAGGCYVPIDPQSSQSRHRGLLEQLHARHMIVSTDTAASCNELGVPHVITLSQSALESFPDTTHGPKSKATPTNAAVILFTSGSTGKPKGVVLDHAAVSSTSVHGHGKTYRLDKTSRVLQFSNYVFDVSLSETITTLIRGGTICVPDELERLHGTADFINRAQATTAFLTPTFARTLEPSRIPTLKKLVVGGELIGKDTLDKWFDKVELLNGYGLAEACICSTTYDFQSKTDQPTTIGFGANAGCWIVDSEDHNKLAPVGCVGELLVQGYVARGYLGNQELTEKSFLDSVKWLPRTDDVNGPRFYKTGDLVRYRPQDGALEILGRKDTQLKLRGQRLEAGGIAYLIKESEPTVEHVAIDILRYRSREILAAFISFTDVTSKGQDEDDFFVTPEADLKQRLITLASKLRDGLPGYMVPTVFLPVASMPFISALKLDQRKLRQIAQSLAVDSLLSPFSLEDNDSSAEPDSEAELKLRNIWAQILSIAPEKIGKMDRFLGLGGDSVSVIQMVSMAQEQGISLSVSDVFKDGRLVTLAAGASTSATATSAMVTHDAEPFSLLSGDLALVRAEIKSQGQLLTTHLIEDAYPTTPLQQGLMALSVKQPGSYIAKHTFKLADNINVDRFKAAWERTVQLCSNLRTRILEVNGSYIQAVVTNDTEWETLEGSNV